MPVTRGTSRARATIAVWELAPPTSIAKPHRSVAAQAQDLVRRQFVADDDDTAVEVHVGAGSPLLACQRAQKVAGDVAKILTAFAQMLALDLRELLAEVVGYRLHRPLRVDPILPDRLIDTAREGGVSQDHRMGMEDRRQVAAVRLRYRLSVASSSASTVRTAVPKRSTSRSRSRRRTGTRRTWTP